MNSIFFNYFHSTESIKELESKDVKLHYLFTSILIDLLFYSPWIWKLDLIMMNFLSMKEELLSSVRRLVNCVDNCTIDNIQNILFISLSLSLLRIHFFAPSVSKSKPKAILGNQSKKIISHLVKLIRLSSFSNLLYHFFTHSLGLQPLPSVQHPFFLPLSRTICPLPPIFPLLYL